MIHEKLYERLKPIGEVYLGRAPQHLKPPYIVYKKISQIYAHNMDGEDSLEHARFQINCYGMNSTECEKLREAVREALKERAFEVSYFEDEEDDNDYFLNILDFEIWEDQI